jgi:hypothetical protein
LEEIMKKLIISLWVVLAGLAAAKDNAFSLQLEGGWFNGLSGEFGVGVYNIGGTAFGLRLGLGLAATTALDPSQLTGVTLGSNSGTNFTVGLDVSYSIDFQSNFTLTPYLGGRFNMFSGSYSGGITGSVAANQFGAGLGVRMGYFIDSQFSLLADLGGDFMFAGSYTVDGQSRSGSDTFPGQAGKTVAAVMNEPGLVVKARIGAAFNF